MPDAAINKVKLRILPLLSELVQGLRRLMHPHLLLEHVRK